MLTAAPKLKLQTFGLELNITIPSSEAEVAAILTDLAKVDELAVDTETVGKVSAQLFEKALKLEAGLAAAQSRVDQIEEEYVAKHRNKRNPEAVKFREFREANQSVLRDLVNEQKRLRAAAIQDPGGLHFWNNILGCVQVGYQISPTEFECYLIPANLLLNCGPQTEALLNSRKTLLFQNAKFDWKMLKQHLGVELHCNNLYDTMIAEFMATNGTKASTSLGGMAKHHLNFELNKDKDLRVSYWVGEWSSHMIEYAALDIAIPFLLREKQLPALDKPRFKLFQFECSLVPHTAAIEMNGIGIDVKATNTLLSQKLADRDLAVVHCVETLGLDPNYSITQAMEVLNSPTQLKKVLIPRIGFIKSTDAKVLNKLESKFDEVKAVLEYRGVNKLITTYLAPMLQRAKKLEDGSYRLYSEFNQTKTETSRYSSEDPNFQNLPATPEFRNLIVARPGHVLLCADLSAIEPRITAHVTNDPLLRRIFNTGKDPYIYMASLFLGIKYDDVTKEQRKEMKVLLLAAIYGRKAFSLAMDLGIPVLEASIMLRNFFEMLCMVKAWVDRSLITAKANGYVETIQGFKRYLPNLQSDDPKLVANAENAVLNTQIQSVAAYCMKQSIMLAGQLIQALGWHEVKLILTVHDELVAEVPDTPEWITRGKQVLLKALVDGTKQTITSVPITVGSAESNFEPSGIYKWGEMKE